MLAFAQSTFVENEIEGRLSRCERFAEEEFRKPGHRHIVTGLKRLNHGLTVIKNSWHGSDRQHALDELESLLRRQHELELAIEKVDNSFLREYARDLLDRFATVRRSLSEEVRWDVDASRPQAVIAKE